MSDLTANGRTSLGEREFEHFVKADNEKSFL